MRILILANVLSWLIAIPLLAAAGETRSGDATIQWDGNRWELSTTDLVRVIEVVDGRFRETQTVGGKLQAAGLDMVSTGFFVGSDNGTVDGDSGKWEVAGSDIQILAQGELQLEITLQRGPLQVTKTYVLYPLSSVIRQWVTYKNVGETALEITDPGYFDFSIQTSNPSDTSFYWMAGGASIWGSWRLYEEPLGAKPVRSYDTYDPFPVPDDIVQHLPGNGTRARILHNDRQIWPADDWAISLHSVNQHKYDLDVDVKTGDRLVFVSNAMGLSTASASLYAPEVRDSEGGTFLSWGYYSTEQGKDGWSYQYYDGEELKDLVNVPGAHICLTSNKHGCWVADPEHPKQPPRIGWNYAQPSAEHDVARVWTAGKDGVVKVTGTFANSWNFCGNPELGPKGGTASYAPWYAYRNCETGDGVFIGWDYFGRWRSDLQQQPDGSTRHRMKVMNYRQELLPGESIETPKAFIGQFHGDIDDCGNACLEWQYRYLWDYTRDNWFPAIRMLGQWLEGCGTEPDIDSTYRKVFRVVDLMRYCGGDVYHRDWGWWNKLGNWDGPDWRSVNQYLAKYDMGLLLYGTTNYAERDSGVGLKVPDGYITANAPYQLDVGQPEVVDAVVEELHRWNVEYGPYTWRNDGGFLAPNTPDDTNVLAQDQGFRKIIQRFLDTHPDCAFQSVNNGGTLAGYEYTQFSSATSFSDGDVGILRNHWASLMLPPDKTSNFPEKAQPNSYDKASWRAMLAFNVDISQDTYDPDKIEGIRELVDIYHFLESRQVVGRWVKVYRPMVEGDEDQTMYFQRLSGDALRGVILAKRPVATPVNIRPKGLIPDAQYTVSFHESSSHLQKSGAEWMNEGIALEEIMPGEIIYLNLPYHPGNHLDVVPPGPPQAVTVERAKNMGYPGVEVHWKPGTDDHWLSHYAIYRDGEMIDKVAKGTFYFDHSAGADPAAQYTVVSVDGAGNLSQSASCQPVSSPRCQIYDDMDPRVVYSGNWGIDDEDPWAFQHSLTRSNRGGDSAELQFHGSQVTWFTKLGPQNGVARVEIDGEAETVDTYSADEMWGIAVWSREFQKPGPHTLKIIVLDEHAEHRSDKHLSPEEQPRPTWVHLDGFQVESSAVESSAVESSAERDE